MFAQMIFALLFYEEIVLDNIKADTGRLGCVLWWMLDELSGRKTFKNVFILFIKNIAALVAFIASWEIVFITNNGIYNIFTLCFQVPKKCYKKIYVY